MTIAGELRFTIDHNGLIDLELKQFGFRELRQLLDAHDAGLVTVQFSAISASERLHGGTYADSYASFERRVMGLSQRPVGILNPRFRLSVTYGGAMVLADDAMIALEERIHSVLFPKGSCQWSDYARTYGVDPSDPASQTGKTWRKWRNQLGDVAGMWCHIHYGGDVFVTRDRNFLKTKKAR